MTTATLIPDSRPMGSLLSRTIRSSAWTVTGFGASQIVRLAANLILTRLLIPEMFGLMTLVSTFIAGLHMFSDIGIGPAIIQNADGEKPRFLNTAWTIQAMRGAALWVCSCIIAVPVAYLYDAPLLKWILPVTGINALIAGFNSTALFTLNRKLQLARLTLLELAQQLIGVIGMVIWAWFDKSIWALVVPSLFASLFTLIASHTLLPGIRNRFTLDHEAKSAMLRFGRWIFASTVLTFFAAQSDRLVFGRMIPLGLLGVYGIALTLAMMPTQAILRIGGMVVFPAYSEASADAVRFKRIFARVRVPLIVCGAMGITALIASGPALVRVLYRPAYWEAGWILQLLAIVAWFQILECTNGSALLAQGSAEWVAAGNAAKLIGMVSFIPLGYTVAPRLGINPFAGAILGLVASEALKYSVSAFAVARRGLLVIGIDLLCTLFIGVGVAIASAATRYVHWPAAKDWMRFGAATLTACLVWTPIAFWLIVHRLQLLPWPRRKGSAFGGAPCA